MMSEWLWSVVAVTGRVVTRAGEERGSEGRGRRVARQGGTQRAHTSYVDGNDVRLVVGMWVVRLCMDGRGLSAVVNWFGEWATREREDRDKKS